MRKLNEKGVAHWLIPLAVMAVVIFAGVKIAQSSSGISAQSKPQSTGITQTQPITFGVVVQNPSNTTLNAFDAAAGKRPSIIMDYRDFANNPNFPTYLSALARSRGQKLMLTWEPWNANLGGNVNQPAYRLKNTYNGTYDSLITRWANEIKADKTPLYLRFAHEMNGNWYPWSEQVNGNHAGDYVKAWQHVHQIFAQQGVTNVTWVWCPNSDSSNSTPISEYYPGDSNVDWTCVDGYNGGSTLPWGGWRTFDQIFSRTSQQIKTLAPTKPLMIGETASSEHGGSKPAWIQDMFTKLPIYQQQYNLQAFFWFNYNKETDWRIQSSAATQSAFKRAVSNPIYK